VSRIRSIKPEFPQSESIGRLSRDARLLFVMIWTIADDAGRARAASRMLASLLYPYDDDAPSLIDGWLDELERHDCIRRYEVDGSRYLEIVNWLKHQKIDHPSISRLPPFSGKLASPREASRSLAPDLGPRTLDQDLGEGEQAPAAPTPTPSVSSKGSKAKTLCRISDNWKPTELDISHAKGQGLDDEQIAHTANKFRDHWLQAADNKGKKKDWEAAWRTWVTNEIDWKKGVENIPRAQSAAKPGKQMIFFAIESPEFAAWKRYTVATTGRGPYVSERESDHKRGSWFETVSPPPLPEKAAA
jgi:hypothetical protein